VSGNNIISEILKKNNNEQIYLHKIIESGDNKFVRLLLDYETEKKLSNY
jgi:hypothetical protein